MKWHTVLSLRKNWLELGRWYSKRSNKYTDTLHLPKTSFPVLRSDATIKREKELQQMPCFSSLYKWQKSSSHNREFVLHDGPPYANGEPHVGHALNKIVKDITNRYKLMSGYKIHYRPGWDCHGLPIELKATADDRTMTALEIRNAARKFARKSVEVQKSQFQSWGIMGDWENCYHTFDSEYQVNQLRIFYAMFEKGLIYQDYLPVYWSPSSRTALAEAELVYNPEHVSTSLYVSFSVSQLPDGIKEQLGDYEELSAIVWTTTPWTLPANEAVCYAPDDRYVFAKCEKTGQLFLMGADAMPHLANLLDRSWNTLLTVTGQELSGTVYQHPLREDVCCELLPASHVSSDQGTGLVHTAPSHGHDDFSVALTNKLPLDCVVDENGCYNGDVYPPTLKGKDVLTEGNDAVMGLLGERVLHCGKLCHSYPYDWRTNQPIIIRASKQWFINTEKIKEEAEKCLKDVDIVPSSLKSSMLTQLDTRPYWCISRQRVWGVPIPVFYEKESGKPFIAKATVEHIASLIKEHGSDSWWKLPMDQLLPESIIEECGANSDVEYVKSEDILDIWFDSGTSWASVLQDNKNIADMYCEGIDQLGAWFQSSLLTSVAVNSKAPYRSLLIHGFTVDERGKKMSKSKGNIIKPHDIINGKKKMPGYGVDVLRWWAAASTKATAGNSEIGASVLTSINAQLYKLKKVCRYLLGNLNDFDSSQDLVMYDRLLPQDKYMLHLLLEFQTKVTSAYDSCRYGRVLQHVENFMNFSVSNFYCNITKDRLYCNENTSIDRRSSQTVMFHILESVTRSFAPILPHLAEEVFIHHPCFKDQSIEETSVFRTGWFKSHNEWENNNTKCLLEVLLEIRKNFYGITKTTNSAEFDLSIICGGELLKELQALQRSSDERSPLTEIMQSADAVVLEENQLFTDDHQTVAGLVDFQEREEPYTLVVSKAKRFRCERCRLHTAERATTPCDRCMEVLAGQWS